MERMEKKSRFLPVIITFFLMTVAVVFSGTLAAGESAGPADEAFGLTSLYLQKHIVVLSLMENYDDAVVFALAASAKLGIRFDHENKWYSEIKKIRYSEKIKDRLYKGSYHPRRYDGEYISLENSDFYKDFPRGYIVVVAGIYADKKDAQEALARIRRSYRRAYIQKTALWMGYLGQEDAGNKK